MRMHAKRAVLSRSAIDVCEHKFGFEYSFEVGLEDGQVLLFKGYAYTREMASSSGIRRSEKMIEKGYREGM